MPSRSLALALAAAALAVPLAGCGQSDDEEVRDVLARFQKATRAHDYRTLCDSVLSKDLVERITRVFPTCETALQRSALAVARQPAIRVQKVRVNGDRAFALVTSTAVGEAPARVTIELVKQNGSWRVASLAGAQPPTPPRRTTPG